MTAGGLSQSTVIQLKPSSPPHKTRDPPSRIHSLVCLVMPDLSRPWVVAAPPKGRYNKCSEKASVSPVVLDKKMTNPIAVIDNYDSFTYNLCQESLSMELKLGSIQGKIVHSPYGVMHGKSSLVYLDEGENDGLFTGSSNPFTAGRYHSLVIEKENFPHQVLEIIAWTEDGLVIAARHKIYRFLLGVQFHPESIVTSEGKKIVIERKEAESRQ